MLVVRYMRRGVVVPVRKMQTLVSTVSVPNYWRPKTRGDCAMVPRPCPFVGCRHNVYLDVSATTGSITFNFPEIPPESMDPMTSCSLDVADRWPSTLDEISSMLNLTRERIRQIADGAIRKLKHSIKLFTLYYEKDHD